MAKQTTYRYSADAKKSFFLQTGEGRWAEKSSESGKGKDFHNDKGQQENYRVVDEARHDNRDETGTAKNEGVQLDEFDFGGSAEDFQRHVFRKENLTNTHIYSNSNAGGH